MREKTDQDRQTKEGRNPPEVHVERTDRQTERQTNTDKQPASQTKKGRNSPEVHVEVSASGEPGGERKPSPCCCHGNQASTEQNAPDLDHNSLQYIAMV